MYDLSYNLTAAASKVQRSGFSMFFFVISIEWESILTGQEASSAKYSDQISDAFRLTWLCGKALNSCTASQNLITLIFNDIAYRFSRTKLLLQIFSAKFLFQKFHKVLTTYRILQQLLQTKCPPFNTPG